MPQFESLFTRRFLLFGLVGGSGIAVQIAVLGALFRGVGLPYLPALVCSVLVAMTSNFLLNNQITYSDRRLHGRALWRGLLTFCVACSIGALVNISSAQLAFLAGVPWAVAGAIGAVAGAVFNYWSVSQVTWRRSA